MRKGGLVLQQGEVHLMVLFFLKEGDGGGEMGVWMYVLFHVVAWVWWKGGTAESPKVNNQINNQPNVPGALPRPGWGG